MSRFVDVAVIPVPSETLDAYHGLVSRVGDRWIEHGAFAYFEGVETESTDLQSHGPGRRIADVVRASGDESVVAFIVVESESHRDTVSEAVANDPAYAQQFGDDIPVDPTRTSTGSFSSIVGYES